MSRQKASFLWTAKYPKEMDGVKYGSPEKFLEVLKSEEVKEEKRKEAQNSE